MTNDWSDVPFEVTYFFYSASSREMKIGRSYSPWDRFIRLRGITQDLEVCAVVPADYVCEAEAHARFVSHHLRGEWFDLEPAYIKDLAAREGWPLVNIQPTPNVALPQGRVTSIRFSNAQLTALDELSTALDLSRSGVMRLALKRLHESERRNLSDDDKL